MRLSGRSPFPEKLSDLKRNVKNGQEISQKDGPTFFDKIGQKMGEKVWMSLIASI